MTVMTRSINSRKSITLSPFSNQPLATTADFERDTNTKPTNQTLVSLLRYSTPTYVS